MNNSVYVAIWEFVIKPEAQPVFEEIYGPDGGWPQLFRQSSDYRGTKLFRDLTRPGRYLTLDYWTSQEALQRFKREHATEYATLDKKCESLTVRETMVGEYEEVRPRSGQ
jgi:heme-degrading monooxygenase HmoA